MTVYIFDELDKISGSMLDALIEHLPHERRERALSYKHTQGKLLCAAAYRVAEYALETGYGIAHFDMRYDDNGKPYAGGHPEIFFNISHCRYGCICAVCSCRIGVDIQEIVPLNLKLAEKICTDGELGLIMSSPDRDKAFTEIWCMKEAYLKMVGTGLSGGMRNIDTLKLREHIAAEIHDRYVTAAATKDPINSKEVQPVRTVLLNADIFDPATY